MAGRAAETTDRDRGSRASERTQQLFDRVHQRLASLRSGGACLVLCSRHSRLNGGKCERLGLSPYDKSTFQNCDASFQWHEGSHPGPDIYICLCCSTSSMSAQGNRVTYGRRRCLSTSFASSFNSMASRQIGREKQLGMSLTCERAGTRS